MKKTVLVLILSVSLALPLNSANSNDFNYSNLTSFKYKKIDQFDFLFTEENPEGELFIKGMILDAKRRMPSHLFKHAKDKKLKIILVKNRTGKNLGAEYVRSNQSEWDGRVNKHFNRSILFLDIDAFIKNKRYALTTFVHELSHFYHLEVKKEMDGEINKAFLNAVRAGKYKNSYASKNKNEYFAEISSAYFSDFGVKLKFPFSAGDLKRYDPVGFELCRKIWGDKAVNTETTTASRPNPFVKRVPKKSPHDNSPEALKEFYIIHNLTKEARLYEYTNEPRLSYWRYEVVAEKLKEFNEKYPNWRNGLILKEMNKIKAILKK